jgi:hypothetical protein
MGLDIRVFYANIGVLINKDLRMNYPQFILGNSLDKIPADVNNIVLLLSPEVAAKQGIGSIIDDLMTLSDSKAHMSQFANGVCFSIIGFDDDPREVPDIPECRQLIAQIHNLWPYWMHFLAPVPEMWSVLLLCLLDIETVPVPLKPGVVGRKIRNMDQYRSLLMGMLDATGQLHFHHQVSEEVNARIIEQAMDAIDSSLK